MSEAIKTEVPEVLMHYMEDLKDTVTVSASELANYAGISKNTVFTYKAEGIIQPCEGEFTFNLKDCLPAIMLKRDSVLNATRWRKEVPVLCFTEEDEALERIKSHFKTGVLLLDNKTFGSKMFDLALDADLSIEKLMEKASGWANEKIDNTISKLARDGNDDFLKSEKRYREKQNILLAEHMNALANINLDDYGISDEIAKAFTVKMVEVLTNLNIQREIQTKTMMQKDKLVKTVASISIHKSGETPDGYLKFFKKAYCEAVGAELVSLMRKALGEEHIMVHHIKLTDNPVINMRILQDFFVSIKKANKVGIVGESVLPVELKNMITAQLSDKVIFSES